MATLIQIWGKKYVANPVLSSWQPLINLIMRITTTMTLSLSALVKLLQDPIVCTTTMPFVLMVPVSTTYVLKVPWSLDPFVMKMTNAKV